MGDVVPINNRVAEQRAREARNLQKIEDDINERAAGTGVSVSRLEGAGYNDGWILRDEDGYTIAEGGWKDMNAHVMLRAQCDYPGVKLTGSLKGFTATDENGKVLAQGDVVAIYNRLNKSGANWEPPPVSAGKPFGSLEGMRSRLADAFERGREPSNEPTTPGFKR